MATRKTATALRGIKIIELMQWGRRFAASEFKDELGIEQRSLQNYIAQLREAGYNIRSERGVLGCYWLEAGERMHPLTFEPEELRTVVVALGILHTVAPEEHPMRAKSKQLRGMITGMMPPEETEQCDAARSEFDRELMMMRAIYTAHKNKMQRQG